MNSKTERRRRTDPPVDSRMRPCIGQDWHVFFTTREDKAARKAIALSAAGWFIVATVSAACFVFSIFGNW